jgi:hypothetical protein
MLTCFFGEIKEAFSGVRLREEKGEILIIWIVLMTYRSSGPQPLTSGWQLRLERMGIRSLLGDTLLLEISAGRLLMRHKLDN